MTLTAFPGHAGRLQPLLGWRLVARIRERPPITLCAFPGHAGRLWPLLGWRLVTRIRDMVDQ